MHNSRAAAAAFPTAASAGSRTIRPLFSPTHFDEEPLLLTFRSWGESIDDRWRLALD
jgi:hypothetical protein